MQEKNSQEELYDGDDRWAKIKRLWEIIDRLRGENGCPWDRQQTPETVQTYLIEEAHEAAAAVRAGAEDEAAEELGDLLFMVFFMIHLYEEAGRFTLNDVCMGISEKMIRRHPHVFGDTVVDSAADVRSNWEKIKQKEKKARSSGLGVPGTLPALVRAYRLISRMSSDQAALLCDVPEEKMLLESAAHLVRDEGAPKEQVSYWLARGLIALVVLARRCGVRPEDCLHAYLNQMERSLSGQEPCEKGSADQRGPVQDSASITA